MYQNILKIQTTKTERDNRCFRKRQQVFQKETTGVTERDNRCYRKRQQVFQKETTGVSERSDSIAPSKLPMKTQKLSDNCHITIFLSKYHTSQV